MQGRKSIPSLHQESLWLSPSWFPFRRGRMLCVFRMSGRRRTLAPFYFLLLWFLPLRFLPLLRLPRRLCVPLFHSPRPLFLGVLLLLLMLLTLLDLLSLGHLPLLLLLFGQLLLLLLLVLTLLQLCVACVLRRRPFPVGLGAALGTTHVVGVILLSRRFASIERPFVLGWHVGVPASVGGAACRRSVVGRARSLGFDNLSGELSGPGGCGDRRLAVVH